MPYWHPEPKLYALPNSFTLYETTCRCQCGLETARKHVIGINALSLRCVALPRPRMHEQRANLCVARHSNFLYFLIVKRPSYLAWYEVTDEGNNTEALVT